MGLGVGTTEQVQRKNEVSQNGSPQYTTTEELGHGAQAAGEQPAKLIRLGLLGFWRLAEAEDRTYLTRERKER